MSECYLCPRRCGVDRKNKTGFCGCGDNIRVAKYMAHFGEEPCITGTKGSGAVFFSGCSLRCVFCQNNVISRGLKGEDISEEKLEDIFFELKSMGVHNINLVTATHFIPQIARVLRKSKEKLGLPIVFNCGGYESVEILRMLEGLVNIYLPDLKYYSSSLSAKYSSCPDYFEKASAAIREMLRQQPENVFEGDIMQKGVIIRHLVLPNCYKDSIKIFEWLYENFSGRLPLISVMRQFFPSLSADEAEKYPELNRKLTTFEYEKVVDRCAELGFTGFMQEKGCDNGDMTPDF